MNLSHTFSPVVDLRDWQDELSRYATAQVCQIFEEAPAVCLFLLEQTDGPAGITLIDVVTNFLDQVTLEHSGPAMDPFAELLPWVDGSALATWLQDQREQHKNRLIVECRNKLTMAYLALCHHRHGASVFVHQQTSLEFSAELVATAIASHIEGAAWDDPGQPGGADTCLLLLGALLSPDGSALSPLGITVMDKMFTVLVEDEQHSGTSIYVTCH